MVQLTTYKVVLKQMARSQMMVLGDLHVMEKAHVELLPDLLFCHPRGNAV